MKRNALGKGLDALLPKAASAYRHVDIDQIRPNPLQPRTQFQDEKLAELAESIREKGLIQPIIVRPAEPGFEIIAGERRWRAAQRAALKKVPVILQDASDQEMLELALIENIQRAELSPIEEAHAYRLMMDQFRATQEEVAQKVGRSRAAVANTVRLLQLPKSIQGLVNNALLSMGHARALLPLPSALQTRLAREIVDRDLSVRETERRVQRLQKAGEKESTHARRRDPNLVAAEKNLEEYWKTRVEIRKRGASGTIVLHYHSDEELDRLYERLLAERD